MNSPTGNAAPNAFDRPGRRDAILSLTTSRGMLPLVQRIVQDILAAQEDLARLEPELHQLDREKRSLDWPARCRRYRLREQATLGGQNLHEAVAELEGLGVTLVDPSHGQVGFPTQVNGRRAFFSWRAGEEEVAFWHFAGETTRHTIPLNWLQEDSSSN
jgi:hypothetical protein